MSTAKATGYLELNINGFEQAISTAKKLMVSFAAGFASYKLADAFKDGVKGAIDFGREMQSASRVMGGFDPGNLFLAQKALEKAGLSAGDARTEIKNCIDEGRELSNLFGGSENLGKALQSAAKDYGPMAKVLSESAAKLANVWNAIEVIRSKTDAFFLSMTAKFVEPLQVAMDTLAKIDLSKMGERFGHSISQAATTIFGIFKNGDAIEALKGGIVYAFHAGADVLMTGFQKVVAFFSGAMDSISKSFRESFFAEDMITLLKDVFKGLGEILSSAMLKAAAQVAKALGMTDTGNTLDQGANREFNASKNHFNSVANITKDTDFLGAGFDVAKAITDGIEAASKIKFGESDSGQEAKKAWDSLRGVIEEGFKTGMGMNRAHGTDGDAGWKKGVPTNFTPTAHRVIADNLARVGGGGNAIVASSSIAAKTLMAINRGTRATEESNRHLANIDKKTGGSEPPMGR